MSTEILSQFFSKHQTIQVQPTTPNDDAQRWVVTTNETQIWRESTAFTFENTATRAFGEWNGMELEAIGQQRTQLKCLFFISQC